MFALLSPGQCFSWGDCRPVAQEFERVLQRSYARLKSRSLSSLPAPFPLIEHVTAPGGPEREGKTEPGAPKLGAPGVNCCVIMN